jgi:nucleotide-binding universal stress UspA family protein
MSEDGAHRVLTAAVELAKRNGIGATSELGEPDRVSKDVEGRSADHDLLVIGTHGASRREGERISLAVVGSRGLSGVKALGSVSERIAHACECSVLVARPELPSG